MKTFFKKFFVFAAILAATFSVTNLSPATVHAAEGDGCSYFLGLQSWNCGLGDDIQITGSNEPQKDEYGNPIGHSLVDAIVIIAANILVDLTVAGAYLSIGFIVYGGYLYILSSGDPGKAASGKKTLTRAFIGTAIVLLANVILNTIRIVFIGNTVLSDCLPSDITTSEATCDTVASATTGELIIHVINWFIGVAGVVSAIFIVVAGVGYVTAGGDPGKLKKSKDTIRYALIGLLITALSFTISAFVANIIQSAEDEVTGAALVNQIQIAKELHEK